MVSPNYITQYLSDNWVNRYELSKLKYIKNFYMRDSFLWSTYVTALMWDFKIHNLLSLAQLLSMMPTLPLYYSSQRSIQFFYDIIRSGTSAPHPPIQVALTISSHFANSATRRSMSDTPDVETKQKLSNWYPTLPDRTIFSPPYHAVKKTYFVHTLFSNKNNVGLFYFIILL